MGLFDNNDEQAQSYLRKILRQYEGIEAPDVDWRDYTPEGYSFDYSPEAMQGQLLQEDPRLLQQQRDYLSRLSGLSETGLSEADAASFEMARMGAGAEAKSQRDALARQAMASGTYGSGQDFASRQMANQAAADRAQQAGLQQAAETARQRALYAQAYGDQLGSVRGQDMGTESANKGIINMFNQMNTQNRNQAGQMRQQVGQQNVDQRNQAQLTNLQGRIGQNQQAFGNQAALAGMKSDAYDKMGSYYANLGNQKKGAMGGILGGAGTIVGGAFGGPVGAAAGGAIGKGVGGLF